MRCPKVSIIVPVFNVKPYLAECLDSILNQTFPEIEIICGDGGSTDGSLEILQEYSEKDERIRYISVERSGYGQSVNDCIDMARGEYIGIVESDDAVKPNTYEVLYKLAKANDLDWIRGDIYFYYSGMPEGKQLKRESIIYDHDFYNVVLNPQIDYRPYKSGLRTWSGIYKREFLNKNGIRHNETPGGSYQDVGFYLKTLYYAQRVYFVDQAFYMWRQDNPGSSVHYNSSKLVEKSLKEWQLNREYLDEHPNIGKRAVASYNYRKFFSYLWTIDMAEGEDKTYVRKIAAEEFTDALDKGEIDKNFFEEWEWSRFIETLQDWKSEKQDEPAQESPVNEESSDTLKSDFSCKRALKKVLRPAANFMRKIIYKLMRNVILDLHYDIDMLRIRINETAEDTQWQIRESAAQLENSVHAITELAENLKKAIIQSKDIFAQIDAGPMSMEEKVQMLDPTSGIAEIVSNIRQEVQDQQAMLKDIKACEENIYGKAAGIEQKVLDQGDVLWSTKTRVEDIHEKTAEIRQKVLDQGDILWKAKDRIEDIYVLGDEYLAHPRVGESKKKHDAISNAISLMTKGDKSYKIEVCKRFLHHVEIEVFSICNRRCWFCPNSFIDRHTHNIRMEEQLYLKILSELKEIKYKGIISFSRYNEPLADEIIFERIKQARDYCPDAWLRFNTNGDFLTADSLEKLKDMGLNEIEIQCYFSENESFSITLFEQRLKELLNKLKIHKYEIVTYDETNHYKANLEYIGMEVTYNALNMVKLGNNRGESLDKGVAEYQRSQNCLVPFRNLYIDYTGTYMMCCNVRSDNPKHAAYKVGHVETDSVYDVFGSDELIAVRKRVGINKKLPSPCASCQYLTCDDDFQLFQ